jgi:hypothetical protein
MATQPTGVFDEVDLTVAPMAIEDVEKRLSALHELDKVRTLYITTTTTNLLFTTLFCAY